MLPPCPPSRQPTRLVRCSLFAVVAVSPLITFVILHRRMPVPFIVRCRLRQLVRLVHHRITIAAASPAHPFFDLSPATTAVARLPTL
ncbi:hypothetical protein GUJ93_ZPchr0006g45130 [Zizania palustris]|uniref:Uncharacterized protein n=1 Tax=Zizania palustris TaxID=103762 RepID=A0A8J5T1P1_ZIZPA|nr:hypothetical protein GUJ93_ZPchr0006g45130 [Zizania palustris]